MSENPLRVAFVGVGSMGQCAHLANYVPLKNCRVVALAELREGVGRRVAERYGVEKVYASAADLLADGQFDAIVASQPFHRHGVLLEELIAAGKPIFIEKPLAASIPVAERILQRLQASVTKLMVGYHKRSDPATEAAMQHIDAFRSSGELGSMRYVRITMPPGDWTAGNVFCERIDAQPDEPKPAGLAFDEPDPALTKAQSDRFITFVNYYIHQVNLLRHLLGEAYRVTHADGGGVLLVARSDSGVSCCIEMAPWQTTRDWQESAMVCFQKGWVKLELPAPMVRYQAGRVEVFKDPGDGATPQTSVPVLPPVHAMRRQAENFLAFARGERPPTCDAAAALEDLRVARDYMALLEREQKG